MADCTDSNHSSVIQSKKCSKCGDIKPVAGFYPRVGAIDGYEGTCKSCRSAGRINNRRRKIERMRVEDPDALAAFRENEKSVWRKAYESDPQKFYQRTKNWKAKNPDRTKEYYRRYREENKEYLKKKEGERRELNKDRINAQSRERIARKRRLNPKHRIDDSVSAAMKSHIKKICSVRKNGRKWESLVGYTVDDLYIHLERQFTKGMSWGNYGRSGWHIDHILPLSSFKYDSPDDPEFKAAWALSNLRPLWGSENMSKNNKILTLV